MDALAQSGDFDDKLFLYHEDCDLQIRLRQLGYGLRAGADGRRVCTSSRRGFQRASMRCSTATDGWFCSRTASGPTGGGGASPGRAELAVLAFAARQGWLREKLASYAEILHLLPAVVRDRRQVQKNRSPKATDGAFLTGNMFFPGSATRFITRVANPVLSAYWRFARTVLRVP